MPTKNKKIKERPFIYFTDYKNNENDELISVIVVGEGYDALYGIKRNILKDLEFCMTSGGSRTIPTEFKSNFAEGVYKFKNMNTYLEYVASQSSDEKFKAWIQEEIVKAERRKMIIESMIALAIQQHARRFPD